jgi:hypothetical protein
MLGCHFKISDKGSNQTLLSAPLIYSVFGIHLGQNRDGKQGRLGILLSLTVVKSAVGNPFIFRQLF